MKRCINIILFLSFLIGYLEWGKSQHSFIFQAEAEVFSKSGTDFISILHPLTIIPFLGQVFILITIFQKKVSRKLSLAGLACLSTLMLLLFFIGILDHNVRILLSTIPFIITGLFLLRYHWKKQIQG